MVSVLLERKHRAAFLMIGFSHARHLCVYLWLETAASYAGLFPTYETNAGFESVGGKALVWCKGW